MNAFDRGGLGSKSMTGLARQSRRLAKFRLARPNGSRRGGRGWDVPDELLGLAGRNRAINAVAGRHFSSDTLNKASFDPKESCRI